MAPKGQKLAKIDQAFKKKLILAQKGQNGWAWPIQGQIWPNTPKMVYFYIYIFKYTRIIGLHFLSP